MAGVRIHQGEEVGSGTWPALIDRGQWDEVQRFREYRAAQAEDKQKRLTRHYVLRGVVTCACGARMAGTNSVRYVYYRCTRADDVDQQKCDRSVSAVPLESFARDVAIRVLTKLDTSGYEPASTTRPEADVIADEKDRAKLEELKQLWLTDDDFTTAEFHAMRAVVLKRMKERQRKTVKRPIAALEGIAGSEAEANWERLEKEEDYARMNAIYRFLFAAVVVRPPTRKPLTQHVGLPGTHCLRVRLVLAGRRKNGSQICKQFRLHKDKLAPCRCYYLLRAAPSREFVSKMGSSACSAWTDAASTAG